MLRYRIFTLPSMETLKEWFYLRVCLRFYIYRKPILEKKPTISFMLTIRLPVNTKMFKI